MIGDHHHFHELIKIAFNDKAMSSGADDNYTNNLDLDGYKF